MSTSSRVMLVCVDNSEFSLHAFNWYVDNVYNKDNDILNLVHVHDLPYLPRFGEASVRTVLTEEYHEMMERSIQNAKAVKMKYEELCKEKKLKYDFFTADAHRKPGYVICKLAEDLKAELIVLGQRGLGTLSRTLYGSTSDYVLHHAQVPVMTVPMPGKKVNNASFKSVGCI